MQITYNWVGEKKKITRNDYSDSFFEKKVSLENTTI